MRRAGMLGLKLAAAIALATTMAPAWAVDVDRIEIHSRLGEPLRAEIPITGAGPQELERLGARLASATTFARIGLPRPSGVVADLRFEVVRGPRPVIRVTSTLPVQEEFLTFLLQVDAPQGRLVREYSLALGASPSLPAALPPEIQAPAANTVGRIAAASDPANALPPPVDPANALPAAAEPPLAPQVVPPVPVAPAPIPLKGDPAPAAAAPPVPVAPAQPARNAPSSPAAARTASAARTRPAARSRTTPTQAAKPPAPAPRPAVPPRPPDPGDYVVRRGDNLSRVVARMHLAGATPQQAMLALLRTNPQAFGSDNINLLRQGAVLRRPPASELTRLDPAAAEAMVRLQIRQWRSGQMPPVAPTQTQAPSVAAAPVETGRDESGPKRAPPRLEIAPAADASLQQAVAGTGVAAGDDPAARARAAADLVAARYTEFQQMQQRIAELERAQQAQQRLLELKDRQLAAQRPQSAGMWPWLVAALAVLAAVGALWRGRREQRSGRVARRLASMVDAGAGAGMNERE